MKPRTCGIVIASLAIVFVLSLTVGGTFAYMTDGGSLSNEFRAGTMPETTTDPEAVQCTILYDANGGTNAPPVQTAIQGETLVLSSETPIPGEGFQFAGWALDSGATEAEYQPGESFVADASLVLYAVWEP